MKLFWQLCILVSVSYTVNAKAGDFPITLLQLWVTSLPVTVAATPADDPPVNMSLVLRDLSKKKLVVQVENRKL